MLYNSPSTTGKPVTGMKRKTARELLAESFRELAEGRSIDKITVKEIAENGGYSTATFYRQFRDKYDLIAWAYSQQVSALVSLIDRDGFGWKQTLLEGALRFQEERVMLKNLLLHTGGHDSFIRYMTEINCQELTRYLLRVSHRETLDPKTALYIRLYCTGTVCLTCEWVLGKVEATPETLAEIYENALPAPLRPYFNK